MIFIIGFIFKRMDILIRGAIRGIAGSVVIYGIGFIMQAVGCVSLVGLNLSDSRRVHGAGASRNGCFIRYRGVEYAINN